MLVPKRAAKASTTAWAVFQKQAQQFCRSPNCLSKNGPRTTKSSLETRLHGRKTLQLRAFITCACCSFCLFFQDLHSQAHSTHTISCGASYIAWLVFQHPRFLQSNMPGGDNKKSKLNIYDVLSFGIQLNQIKANKKQTCISPLMLQPASTDCFTFSKDVFTFDLTISYQAIQVYPASAHSRPYRPYLPR